MRKSYLLLSVFLVLLLCICCSVEKIKAERTSDEQRSFCFWDTNYKIEHDLWNTLKGNHMYIRYFDVDWDAVTGEAKPIATVSCSDSLPFSFTPSIFFTNKVFQQSSLQQLDSLSVRIKRRIETVTKSFGSTHYHMSSYFYDHPQMRDSFEIQYQNQFKEILIDCDWTAGTRDNFFYFLNQLQKKFPEKELTVTLRLWQYKQREKNDIPPVNRCLLMCYNMQTVNDFNVENSIGSMEELKKFVSGVPYPLPLDVALPLFSWGALFRQEQFIGLLGDINENTLSDNFIEFQRLDKGKYRVLTDKVINNYFIRNGDIIRIEQVSPDELHQISDYLAQTIPMDPYSRITFFSWKKSYINSYGTDEIKTLYTAFNR